jgi:hypothetical protein
MYELHVAMSKEFSEVCARSITKVLPLGVGGAGITTNHFRKMADVCFVNFMAQRVRRG